MPGTPVVRRALPGVWVVRFAGPRPLMRAVPEHYGSTMHLAGCSEWTSGGERWSSGPGSISLKVPGEVAVERAREGTPAFQVAFFETSLIEEAKAALDRPRIRSWLHSIDPRDPRAKPLATLHRHLLDETPASASALEEATCEAVHALIDTMGAPSGTGHVRLGAHVSRARALLDERFTETIDLEALAAHARLDKFRLCRAFREQVRARTVQRSAHGGWRSAAPCHMRIAPAFDADVKAAMAPRRRSGASSASPFAARRSATSSSARRASVFAKPMF